MDKPKNGNTITIKINGTERPTKNQKQQMEAEPKQERESSHSTELQSPSANYAEREAAAAHEVVNEGENFEWILPEDLKDECHSEKKGEEESISNKDKHSQFPFMNPKKREVNPEKRKWLTTIFLIVLCAVILGTIFGVTMLNMVLPEEKASPVSKGETVAGQEQSSAPVASEEGRKFTLKQVEAFVVQAGVYSSREMAEREQTALTNTEIPAQVLDMSELGMAGKFAVFVGIANTAEEAKKLSQEISAGGLETFTKEIKVGGKNIAVEAEDERKLLAAAPDMYQSISAAFYERKGTDKLSAERQLALSQLEKNLTAIDKEKINSKQVLQIYSELKEGDSQLKNYIEKPNADTETAIQQHLLTFFAVYHEL